MKKTFLFFVVILITTTTAFSQIQFGGGLTAGSRAGFDDNFEFKFNFGLNARVLYDFSDDFDFTGGISYYLPSKIDVLDETFTYNYFAINADAMYHFLKDGDIDFYALGGFNYAFIDFDTNVGFNTAGSGFGFEVGAGALFDKFYFEVKYDANVEQILGFVGIYLN